MSFFIKSLKESDIDLLEILDPTTKLWLLSLCIISTLQSSQTNFSIYWIIMITLYVTNTPLKGMWRKFQS